MLAGPERALVDPEAGRTFLSHLEMYATVPGATGGGPGILLPFAYEQVVATRFRALWTATGP
jgi:hypothetical protein